MKKKVISILLVGIMVHSVYVCGDIVSEETDNDEIYELTQEEFSESEIIQDKGILEKQEETPQNNEMRQEEDGESTEPIYIIEPQCTQDDTYEMQDWQAAYAEYIEGLEENERCYYSLIYVDEDDIPELVIDTRYEAGGCKILTFHNGVVDTLQTARLNFAYIEKKNLINNSAGHMGYYYDKIYSIKSGKWVYVTGGEWTETMGGDDWVYQYEWEGESVEEEVYANKVDENFDWEQAKRPEQYERLDEMLFRLQTGTALSQTHRYELYVEDITWDEAQKRCEEKGGYLAAITTIEEYGRIKNGIESSGQTQVAYWVGASDDYPSSYPLYEWREPNREYSKYILMSNTIMREYWAEGEPSYCKQADVEQIGEAGVYLLYDDTKEDCHLYDAPMDMLLRNPDYADKIGYICEYDSYITVMSKKAYYKADGNINHRYEYEYDSNGNMTKEIFHSDSYRKWKEWEYDDTGNVTKEIDHDFDGSILTQSEYEYDSAGNQTKMSYYTGFFSGDSHCDEWEYDDAGNQMKHIRYDADGSVDWWKEYEYDNVGNQVKYVEYNGDGSVYEWAEWEYDNMDNMIKYMKYKWGGVDEWEEYEYDDEKNMTKETKYNADGSIDCWCEYEYDGEKNMTKKTKYNADGSVDSWGEYGYDSVGNETKCIIFDADGSISVGYEYEYDSAGNKVKYIEYNADGSIGYMSGYEYEYDSRGNKTKEAIFNYSDHKYTVWFEWVYDNMDNVTKYTYYRLSEVQECEEYEYITIPRE